MADRLLYDHYGDVTRTVITQDSDEDGEFHIQTSQDMEPVIQTAKNLREANEVIGHRKSENMVPVAEVPMQVYEQAYHEGWLHDEAAWKRWLNDPDNKVFRITDGRA